jgi:hypothetical protein
MSRSDESPNFPVESVSVELSQLHDEPTGGVLPSLLSVYQERGYERGYQQAVSDVVSSLFAVTEDFVSLHSRAAEGAHDSPTELRRLLYEFGQQLERRLRTLSPDSGFVADGLGI